MRKNLRNVEMGEHEWYVESSRSRADGEPCELCARSFRRESDKQRHKCVMRDRSRCVNSEVQHSADNAGGGLGG